MDKPQEEKVVNACPRVVMSGLRGGSGKTIITLGLIGALCRRGMSVAPFKKGPDYIDPQWLSLAAGRSCRNLDSFLMGPESIMNSIGVNSRNADIAVIEGNRGLYDGMDEKGTYSTAELAVMLDSPLTLIVDCTKTTRTIAAMVLGCKLMNPDLKLSGVILNQVARNRQEKVIRSAVEQETGIPVLGSLSRMSDFSLFERHLGLSPPKEHMEPESLLERIIEAVEKQLDIEAILQLSASAPLLRYSPQDEGNVESVESTLKIGVMRDEAFHFYYPENLEALERQGAQLIEVSALHDASLPQLDALYIGGGFPESFARELSENTLFRNSLLSEIEDGMPVLAECGGLVYLSKALITDGLNFPMVGVFPITFSVDRRPQGHGYTSLVVDKDNPFFPLGSELRGHEFRYSSVCENRYDMSGSVFRVDRGYGFDGRRDGLLYNKVLASFCHHHASGTVNWAEGIFQAARHRKKIMHRNCITCG